MSQPTSAPPFAVPFPTTDWSAVTRAGAGDGEQGRRALAALVSQYLPAIKSYLLVKHRLSPDRADDVAQAFLVSKVLEQGLFARADRARGKFRNFLMTTLDRFVVSELRRQQARQRAPAELATLEAAKGVADPAAAAPHLFDIAWARQVLDLSLRNMRQECDVSGRPDVWGVFEARVLAPALEQPPPSYRELVERFGLSSPEQASNVLITAKRMFLRNLRAVVRQYATDDSEVEEEIVRLRAILSDSGA